MIGRELAHYKILEKLGSGGMGDGYLAEDTKLDRNVALKVLPPELAGRGRERFEREAKAIAALDHPNIVQVFSVEEADGVHFITMQLVHGKTLSELLPANGFSLNQFFDALTGKRPFSDRISREGGERTPVPGGPEPTISLSPNFSPDGTSIYYSDGYGPEEKRDLWRVSLEDATLSRVTRLEGRRGKLGYVVATDGRYLYFIWSEDVGDIWVMDVVTDH